jgi:cytochrome c peroxidase
MLRLATLWAFLTIALGADGVTPSCAASEALPADFGAMKQAYQRPPVRVVDNPALVELGRDLFFDPLISASGTTSCASCHSPQAGWSSNEARSKGDSGHLTSRKTQTLIGLGYARAPFDWDGRAATLEAQAVSAIGTGSMSMFQIRAPVKVADIVARIRASDRYPAMFKRALPDAAINLDSIVIALAAFERTIEPVEAPFDRWIAGDEQAISEAAKRGFILFNGKGNCAGCHGGWRFTDDKFHDIGTTTTDLGRGREIREQALMQFAFKTPTLRSVGLRAPYMHNGNFATLDDAVRHYVSGGIERPSRSPLMKPVALTDAEQKELVAFLNTLGGEAPAR